MNYYDRRPQRSGKMNCEAATHCRDVGANGGTYCKTLACGGCPRGSTLVSGPRLVPEWLGADYSSTDGRPDVAYYVWNRCGTRPSPTSNVVSVMCCSCVSVCVHVSVLCPCGLSVNPLPNCLFHHVHYLQFRCPYPEISCFQPDLYPALNSENKGGEVRERRKEDVADGGGVRWKGARRGNGTDGCRGWDGMEEDYRRNGTRRRRMTRTRTTCATEATRRRRRATDDGGGGDAGGPQATGHFVHLACLAIFALGWSKRRLQQRRRQRDTTMTMTGVRIACCTRAGRRRNWRRRELAAILDAVRREDTIRASNGAVLLVTPVVRAAPALGAYRARGWLRPPASTAPGAFLAQGCGGGSTGGERGKNPERYAHHGRGSFGKATTTTAMTTTGWRAAIKHKRSCLRIKRFLCLWLKLIILATLLVGAEKRGESVAGQNASCITNGRCLGSADKDGGVGLAALGTDGLLTPLRR